MNELDVNEEMRDDDAIVHTVPASNVVRCERYWRLVTLTPSNKRLKGVRIELRFYRTSIDRYLKVDSPKWQDKLDVRRSMILDPIESPYDFNDVILRTQRELDNMIDGSRESKSPAAKNPEKPAKPTKAIGSKVLEQVDTFSEHTGTYMKSGYSEREVDGETFDHFYLDLHDEELNAEKRLWGKDLKRALTHSGARVGNHIKVTHTGNSPVDLPRTGEKRDPYLKNFVIEILDKE